MAVGEHGLRSQQATPVLASDEWCIVAWRGVAFGMGGSVRLQVTRAMPGTSVKGHVADGGPGVATACCRTAAQPAQTGSLPLDRVAPLLGG